MKKKPFNVQFLNMDALGWIAPMVFIVLWQHFDQTYPRGDAGEYFNTTQEIYYKFKSDGIFSGLYQLYFLRVWKANLFPVLPLPLMMISGGNIRFTIATFDIGLMFVFLFFVSKILQEFIKNSMQRILLMTMLGTLPIVLNSFQSKLFSLEAPYLTLMSAILYFSVKSDFLKNRLYSIGLAVSLTLAFSIRPFLSAIIYLIPLFLFINTSIAKKKCKKKEVMKAAILLGITTVILGFTILLQRPLGLFETFFLLGFFFIFFWFVTKNEPKNSVFFISFSVFYFGLLTWYAPHIYSVFNWATMATFGEFAQQYGGRDKKTTLEFLYTIVQSCSLFSVALLGVIHVLQIPAFKTYVSSRRFISIVCIATTPFLVGLLTYNADTRYYYTTGFILALSLGIVIFQNTQKLQYKILSYFGVLLIIFIQINNGVATLFKSWPLNESLFRNHVGWIEEPMRHADPVIDFLRKLKNHVPENNSQFQLFHVYWDHPVEVLAEQWPLTLVSRESGVNWAFSRQEILTESNFETLKKEGLQSKDYILIGPLSVNHMKSSNKIIWKLAKAFNASNTLNKKVVKTSSRVFGEATFFLYLK